MLNVFTILRMPLVNFIAKLSLTELAFDKIIGDVNSFINDFFVFLAVASNISNETYVLFLPFWQRKLAVVH